jgi:hypothetical protein
VLYDYDTNYYIHAEAMKTKTAASILAAYKRVITVLIDRGCHPRLQRLDNEASKILKDFIHAQGWLFAKITLLKSWLWLEKMVKPTWTTSVVSHWSFSHNGMHDAIVKKTHHGEKISRSNKIDNK